MMTVMTVERSIRAVWRLLPGACLLAAAACIAPPATVQGGLSAEERLDRARTAIREGRHTEAIRSARWAYQIAESDDIRGEALFLEAEGLFHQEEYFEAHGIYLRVVDEHSGHGRFREAVAREHQIGTLLLKGSDPGRFLWFRVGREEVGVKILERIVEEFPAERFAEDSQFLIATFHFDHGEYEEAKESYRRLVEEFPASKWAAISLFQTAECSRLLSRGIRYDATPLQDAKSLYEKYIEQHPRGDKVEAAEERIAEIEGTFAEEEYEIARGYLREGKYRSAEVYLRSIIRHFPETPTAQVARETLRSMDLPVPDAPVGGEAG